MLLNKISQKHIPHQNGEGHRNNRLMPGQVTQLKNFFPDGENLETLHFFLDSIAFLPLSLDIFILAG